MNFEDWMTFVVHVFESAGVAILAIGSIIALFHAVVGTRRRSGVEVYEAARRHVGRSIMLGLEVLIVADIVDTVTISPTPESALVLAVIVLVRTFLSFSLEIELEGVLPWRTRVVATESSVGDEADRPRD